MNLEYMQSNLASMFVSISQLIVMVTLCSGRYYCLWHRINDFLVVTKSIPKTCVGHSWFEESLNSAQSECYKKDDMIPQHSTVLNHMCSWIKNYTRVKVDNGTSLCVIKNSWGMWMWMAERVISTDSKNPNVGLLLPPNVSYCCLVYLFSTFDTIVSCTSASLLSTTHSH